ncbi:uncharacterized protein LOC121369075 [Gigantopelta aegis]|uniref:uncharacterized protein LOC121369075 n=1 Tax=Gigantopelta aegis TaxID=1735272 RepID=UPI001B88B04F|nr:uncharacterized protein LOC121369075 [Gigantopelta aegis]
MESMPLDYGKIREYCKEGGHMSRFLSCVDDLVQQCENEQKGDVLLQFINPDRVRTSVPNLCNNVDVLEASAPCLKTQMQQQSTCKEKAHEMVNRGMVETPGNATAMFIVQCRFFNILAECQRKSVAENCGSNLGDLHADFLLSFVPDTCSAKNIQKPKIIAPPHKPMTSTPSPDPTPRPREQEWPSAEGRPQNLTPGCTGRPE